MMLVPGRSSGRKNGFARRLAAATGREAVFAKSGFGCNPAAALGLLENAPAVAFAAERGTFDDVGIFWFIEQRTRGRLREKKERGRDEREGLGPATRAAVRH
jgi:hypothetical protein